MSKRDFKDLLEQAKRAGADVTLNGAGHYRVTAPGGEAISCAASPSDHRAVARLRSDLRRLGLLAPRRCLSADERAFLEAVATAGDEPWRGEPPRCAAKLAERGLVRLARRRDHHVAWLTERGREAL